MVLYIDACVRKNSRTRRLADCLLHTLNAPYTRLRLAECVFPTVDEAFLEKRDRLLREGDFDNPVFAYARQFAQADKIDHYCCSFLGSVLSCSSEVVSGADQRGRHNLSVHAGWDSGRLVPGGTAILRHNGRRGLLPGTIWIWVHSSVGAKLLSY